MILRPTVTTGQTGLSRVVALYNSGGTLRPMSNLLKTRAFPLASKDLTGLLALFRIKLASWRSTQMWCAIVAEMLIPELPTSTNLAKVAKELRENIKIASDGFTALESPAFASVNRTSTGYQASLAVMVVPNALRAFAATTDLTTLQRYLESDGDKMRAPINDKTVSTNTLSYKSLKDSDRRVFKAMNANLRLETIAENRTVLFLDFDISKAQTENICNNDFKDVRPIDLYGLVRTWAQARTDTSIRPPASTKPLADIAATLPSGGESRLSAEDGILVDNVGDFYVVPEKIDNISRYDTALALALTGPNGHVSQRHPDGLRKLPNQQNVYIDWVNYKWAFVNTAGNLEIRDLSRAQPLNVSHIRSFLATVIASSERVLSFISRTYAFANTAGLAVAAQLDAKTLVLNGIKLINLHPDYEGTTIQDFRLYHLSVLAQMAKMPTLMVNDVKTEDFDPYVEFSKIVYWLVEDIAKNPDKFYKQWAVESTAEYEAWARIFDKYAKNFDQVDVLDRNRRAKYTAPSIDKSYVMPDLPYMAKQRGLMPHQFNSANMLRDSPDNVVLAVDAGGGKTSIIVTDILKEMKSGVKGPFLVMCPSHLVPQYVIEFSYFTESRINTIPVTSYTMHKRRGGLEGLRRMLEVAPINSVVIADYNLAKGGKTVKVGYGTSSTQVYRVVEFLRQFRFNYVALDESHSLKNMDATQSKAVATLIADIPKKRLASGTFMANSPEDMAGQFSLMDPTVFGSTDDFAKAYSADGSGGKIRKMRPGADLEILNKLRSNCRYVQVKRKEWAALLPPRIESMDHFVTLSTAQRAIYDTILQQSIEQLTLAAAGNAKLAAMLGLLNLNANEQESMLDEIDEGEDKQSEMSGGIDELLRPYLARLEQFLCAPGKDLLGASLSDEDKVSPKVAEFVKICQEHLDSETPGKILAFTNQTASAEELYNNLPPSLQKRAILYTAGQKEVCGAEFEHNPQKVLMLGVGQSMETGLNLQHASRLIRVETVMSPGALEQGNSRIGRPNLKKTETRKATYYDWILVDHSIDVTKVAYLLTKKVRIAAIEEADNPIYAKLDVPELFKLTLDNIRDNNTFETLEPYMGPNGMYREYQKCVSADYAAFQDTHKELLDENGVMKMVPLARSEDLPDSKIMRRLPYVPGLDIYGTKELGLVRVDQYLRISADANAEDDDDSDNDNDVALPGTDSDELAARKQKQADFKASVVGLNVHTGLGDGVVVGGSVLRSRLQVRLASGETAHVSMLSCYVITKPQTSGKDIRSSLAKMAGTIPIDTPYDVPEITRNEPTEAEVTKVKSKGPKAQEFSLNLVVTNDLLGLELVDPLENKVAAKTLKLVHFQETVPYYYANLKTPQAFQKLTKALSAQGFTVPSKTVLTNLFTFYQTWSKMKSSAKSLFGQATAAGLRNFYQVSHKPNSDPKQITAYITVEDEQVYFCMPALGHKGNTNVYNKVHVPTVKFYRSAPQLVRFFSTPQQMLSFIKGLLAAGVVLSNEEELNKQVRHLHKLVPHATKMTMNEFYDKNKQK